MKKSGFSILEIVVIMGVTSLLSLGSLALIRLYQKSTNQIKQVSDFEVLVSLISKQFSQLTVDAECTQYLPPSQNNHIYTSTVSNPDDPMTQTPMYLMAESSSTQLRISGDRAHPTNIGGVEYQLMLHVTDNICADPARLTSTWCTGTLNLVATRIGARSSFLGLESLSKGYATDEGKVANLVFQVSAMNGALSRCATVPDVVGGAIDYGTCAYFADPNNGYTPDSTKTGILGNKVECPPAYLSLAACADSCSGKASSILCCRLRNPSQYKKVNPFTHLTSDLWGDHCDAAEVVTGVCNGGGCAATPMKCSYMSANIIDSFCRTVPLSGQTWCNRWEVITDYCPLGATCATGTPGTIRCCKIKR